MIEVFFLSLLVLVPTLVLAFLSTRLRRFLLAVGLVLAVASEFIIAGPDNPMLVFSGVAYGIVAGALLVELGVFFIRMINRGRLSHG